MLQVETSSGGSPATNGASDPWPLAEIAGPDALTIQIRDCMATGVGRQCLLLRLSRLPPNQARPLHLRLARTALAPLAALNRARLYQLADDSLIVVWRGDAGDALRQTSQGLSELLIEGSSLMSSVHDLAELKRLPQDGPALLRLLQQDSVERKQPAAQVVPKRELDSAALQRLEQSLAGADVARFVRRRQVWHLARDTLSMRWEKRYLSVAELAETLEPGLLPKANAWLFRRLTRTLDGRMLALLASIQELQDAGPFSLNINAASILSPAFLRFDTILPARLRGEVVLELLVADMLADPALFLFARNFARARRYRLLLRGVTPATLDVFDLDRVEMDYLRLEWTPEMATDGTAAAIRATGDPSRILLSGADDGNALDWGCSIGIQLFQGGAAERRGLA